MNSWTSVVAPLGEADKTRVISDVAGQLKNMSLAEMRGGHEKLMGRVAPLVQGSLSRFNLQADAGQVTAIAREVVARVGGMGFLEPLLRIDAGLSEITITPNGSVWVMRKGAPAFERLPISPSLTDVFRADSESRTALLPIG